MSIHIPGTVPPITSPGVQGEINNRGSKSALTKTRMAYSVAGRRAEALEFALDAARARSEALYETVSTARESLGIAEERVARITDRYDPQTPLRDAEEIIDAKRDVEKTRRQYDAARARHREAVKDENVLSNHFRDCLWLLNRAPKGDQVGVPKIKGDPTETITRINAEIAAIKKAPPPQAEIIAEAVSQIDKLAAEAVMRVSISKRQGARVGLTFPVVAIAAEPSGAGLPHARDPLPWLCRFHRDALIKDLKAQVAEKYRDVELALSDREKTDHIAELEAERLAADRIRCAKIWEAHEANPTTVLAFPPDADVRAILGIDGPKKLSEQEIDERQEARGES